MKTDKVRRERISFLTSELTGVSEERDCCSWS